MQISGVKNRKTRNRAGRGAGVLVGGCVGAGGREKATRPTGQTQPAYVCGVKECLLFSKTTIEPLWS